MNHYIYKRYFRIALAALLLTAFAAANIGCTPFDYYDPTLEPDPESDKNIRKADEKLPLDPNEANIYHRRYITRWASKEFKWIEHISYRTDKYKPTKEAERMLNIFCSDKIFDIQKELDMARDPNRKGSGEPTGQ